ncbi:MAG: TlpA family protein disulfide reductase [Chloroflexota bacterium]|nr:TlpA family protein disulfide reductase [Chloroflexota bacterium]
MSAGAGRRSQAGAILWTAVIVLTAAALVALLLVPLVRRPAVPTGGALVGSPAPPLDARDLTGQTWRLTAAGRQLTWVNFWASWCPPCRTEMPAMQGLAEQYGERLLVLGMNWGEERSAVEDFVRRYAIDYPILLDPTLDNYYRWSPQYGLPRHYFVDADGIVVRDIAGELPPTEMVATLVDLIGPPEARATASGTAPPTAPSECTPLTMADPFCMESP